MVLFILNMEKTWSSDFSYEGLQWLTIDGNLLGVNDA